MDSTLIILSGVASIGVAIFCFINALSFGVRGPDGAGIGVLGLGMLVVAGFAFSSVATPTPENTVTATVIQTTPAATTAQETAEKYAYRDLARHLKRTYGIELSERTTEALADGNTRTEIVDGLGTNDAWTGTPQQVYIDGTLTSIRLAWLTDEWVLAEASEEETSIVELPRITN